MPINFGQPVTSDNYATVVLPSIRDAHAALAQWLDPAVAGTLTGTPTGAFQLSSANSQVKRFNGTSWDAQAINGLTFDGTNAGFGIAVGLSTLHVQGTSRVSRVALPAQYIESILDAGSSRFTSYSDPTNAKPLIFDATTNPANDAVTGGSLGIYMRVLGVTRFSLLSTGLDIVGAFSATTTGRFNGATQGVLGVREGASGATANTGFDTFVIEDDTNCGMSILTPLNGIGAIFFGDSSSNSAGQLRYNHSTETMTIYASGLANFLVTAAGADVVGEVTSTSKGLFNGATLGFLGVKEGTGSGSGAANSNYDSFVIDGSGNAGISVLGSTTSTQGIIFGDTDNNVIGRLTYAHATDTMVLTVNGTTAWSAVAAVMTMGGGYDLSLSDTAPSGVLSVGFRGSPIVTVNAASNVLALYAGKTMVKTNTTAYTWTIQPDATIDHPIGTIVAMTNSGSAGNVTVARGAGVALINVLTDANQTLTPGQSAQIQKMAANSWRWL